MKKHKRDGTHTISGTERQTYVYNLVTKAHRTNGRCRLINLRKYGKVLKWILNKVGVTR